MFQKEKLSKILEKIRTKYESIQDFANHADIDRGYLSRQINMKLDNPPTPKILKRIADNSKGVTTYEELMAVCGYIPAQNELISLFKTQLNTALKRAEDTMRSMDSLDKNLYIAIIQMLKKYNHNILNRIYHITLSDYTKSVLNQENKNYSDVLKILFDYILDTLSPYSLILGTDYYDYIKIQLKPYKEYYDKLSNPFNNLLQNTVVRDTNIKKIPIVGTVAAGEPILAQENIIDYVELPLEWLNKYENDQLFGLKIKGDSMFPRILDGDYVIVKQQNDCESGQIAVVLVDGNEATVKKVKKTDSSIILIPNNPMYPQIVFSNKDDTKKTVKIIGIVVRLIGNNFE